MTGKCTRVSNKRSRGNVGAEKEGKKEMKREYQKNLREDKKMFWKGVNTVKAAMRASVWGADGEIVTG